MAKPVRSERVTIRLPRYLLTELKRRARKDALPLNFVIVAALCAESLARKYEASALTRGGKE